MPYADPVRRPRRQKYGKLIRDRIPRIIEESGSSCRVRRLSPGEYGRALREKIREEAEEMLRARGRNALINELIDIQELLDAIRRSLGMGAGIFLEAVRRKRRERGGFRKRLFLEYTEGRAGRSGR